jgi:hypothetical protein
MVSRRPPCLRLAEHFVHGVDDHLRLFQLNLVTWMDDPVHAARREVRQSVTQNSHLGEIIRPVRDSRCS